MPKGHLIVYKYGGGQFGHPIRYGVKTMAREVFVERTSFDEVIRFARSLDATLLQRRPDYGNLERDEIERLDKIRLSILEK